MKFSVVVPVYNEEGNLQRLHKELKAVMKGMGSHEIIYVDDGSTDNTARVLGSLQGKVITLQRNYGQSAALDAGFKAAQGDFVISIDADLQNDPKDIPRLYTHLVRNKLDVVAGWRQKRKDPILTRVLTRIGRLLRGILIKDQVHDSGCTLRVYRRAAVQSLDLWGEMHRYIIALLRWKGFRTGELKVNHRARHSGTSKYTGKKAINGLTDLVFMWFINKYSRRPLHLFGTLSYLLFGLGILSELYLAYLKITRNIDLSDHALFPLGFFFILIALQLFVSGVMLDVLLRNYFNSSRIEERYIIKRVK